MATKNMTGWPATRLKRALSKSGSWLRLTRVATSLEVLKIIVAARATDEEFTLMPLIGIGNNLCYVADITNSKEGIEGY
jgi:hypothetical protein